MSGRLIQFKPEDGTNVTAKKFTILFNKEPIGTAKPNDRDLSFFDAALNLPVQDLGWVVQKALRFFKIQSQSQVN